MRRNITAGGFQHIRSHCQTEAFRFVLVVRYTVNLASYAHTQFQSVSGTTDKISLPYSGSKSSSAKICPVFAAVIVEKCVKLGEQIQFFSERVTRFTSQQNWSLKRTSSIWYYISGHCNFRSRFRYLFAFPMWHLFPGRHLCRLTLPAR